MRGVAARGGNERRAFDGVQRGRYAARTLVAQLASAVVMMAGATDRGASASKVARRAAAHGAAATPAAPTVPTAPSIVAGWHQGWLVIGLAVLALLLVAAAVVVYVVWRKRRRRRRRHELGPRLPVVLAHGIMGFDEIRVGPIRRHYFAGIPGRLGDVGCEVHRPAVARAGAVAERARQLAAQVRAIDARKVTIIAHSMGGLDARYAISRLDLGKKVAALVTVGTPHLGTPIADLGTEILGDKLGLAKMLSRVGVDLEAFYDLTSLRMEAFNREIADVRGVEYTSVVAKVDRRGVNPMLLPTFLWLAERVGANDGLVPSSSQRWGEVLLEIEADHWAQVGWGRRFDAREFYAGLVKELRARGF
jgi:triacylglycerol lipase